MAKGRRLLGWAGILLLSGAASFYGIQAQGEKEPLRATETGRPDQIKIDTLAAYQKLELPPVTFSHDRHTKALRQDKQDCTTCHLVENGKLSLDYMRRQNTQAAALQEIYHANCIGCHMERAAAGKKTGPPDGLCRDCHNVQPQIAAARLDAGFNLVSHFWHINPKLIPADQNGKDNCSRCHHKYDAKAKKTFYAQGQEETCRDCHLAKEKEGVKSLEQAAHLQCVLCHLDLDKRGMKDHGPYDCAGCHGAAA